MKRHLLLLLGVIAWVSPATGYAAGYSIPLPCAPRYETLARHGEALYAVCPDHTIHVLALPSGHELLGMDAHPVLGAKLSPHGRRIALVMNDHSTRLVRLRGEGSTRTLDTRKGTPWPIVFMGKHQIFIGKALWDIASAHPVAHFPTAFGPVDVAAMSPHRKRLATAGGDTVVSLYDAGSSKLLHRYTGLKLEPFGLAFTPDGSRLLVGGVGDRVTVLDASTGKPLTTVDTGKTGVAAIVPLKRNGWLAVQYFNPRTNRPSGWQLVNIDTEAHRPLCPGATMTGISGSRFWCVRIKGRTLYASPQPFPGQQ